MKLVKLLLRSGLIAGIAFLVYKQWNDESAGAAEWIATGPSGQQSIPETEDELRISDAEEEGLPARDPFEGQDPLTAPLPKDI